jgi:dTDP-4-dehydrorhamnose reductase
MMVSAREDSERPRILLTGVSGQLGWELRRALMPIGDLICTAGPDPAAGADQVLDLGDPDATRAFVRRAAPDYIINPAAYTQVDRAEEEPERAAAINAIAPAVLAEEAARCGALIVHYSTDYVFDGRESRPYSEHYPPSPESVYGKTKLDGEQAVTASGATHLVLRTSWLYGARGSNFLLTILRLARTQSELRIVDDQRGAPTWARLVAEATAQILAQAAVLGRGWLEERSGVYHLTAAGSTTWYGFARAILARLDGSSPLARLLPIATADYTTRATRPAFSVLDCSRMAEVFRLRLSPWEEQLARVMEDLGPNPVGGG